MPGSLIIRYLPERILFNLACLAFFTFKKRGLTFLKAKFDFLRNWRQVRQKRRSTQDSREISEKELRRLLDPNWLRYRRNAAINK
jgi:hypothetical protein